MRCFKKNSRSKSEDLIGFIEQVMNQAAFHVATQRSLQGLVQSGRFSQEEGWGKGAVNGRK